ncbi:MAG TPA: YdiU family protein [Chromatiales bacterium]|nr:YdiU family protein [Chromatiales bacterium]
MCATIVQGSLESLRFDNSFVRELPGDADPRNLPRQVFGACYTLVTPTAVAAPHLLACAPEVARLIGLDPAECQRPEFAAVFAGNALLPGMEPYAACYGGHQFGQWAGQLGDGRALVLGELINPEGERLSLQLKGAGITPYARTADGRAVLRSSLREFLCSEAMHHLGIPTTRALSLVATGEPVLRDMLYTGDVRPEPGAVVCRVAPSFTRFGHFEIHAARREQDLLRRLADYTLRTDFPELGEPGPEAYLAMFREVCRRTAHMLVHWMRVGFVHGVMNTDNMSILGLTIDYGPYGWLEDYDPDWTPNTTDAQGRRYAFGRQPKVAAWNLARLGEALLPLVGEVQPLQEALEAYSHTYAREWRAMMAAKLGLRRYREDDDKAFVEGLLEVMQQARCDWTIFFRTLIDLPGPEAAPGSDILLAPFERATYLPEGLEGGVRSVALDWLRRYQARRDEDALPPAERTAAMRAVNPKYVPRNYLAQQAIERAEAGDLSLLHTLQEVLRRPYDEQPEHEALAAKRPEWARHKPGCSMLSCSS